MSDAVVPRAREGELAVRLPSGHGGTEVWRVGDRVVRPQGPHSPTVHAFLRHLEDAGFDGAPRLLGVDDEGREVLSYIEGEVLGDPAWRPGMPGPWPEYARSEAALTAAGELLGRFHRAAATFRPDAPTWKQYDWPLAEGEIVCHGDLGRHNTVYRDGMPVAFIDWETIRPMPALVEFGAAAWNFVPLGTDEYFDASDFDERPDLGRRLADFASAYGVTGRDQVMWGVQQAKQRSVETMRHWPITPGEAAAYLRLVAADLEWLDRETLTLGRHLD
jgi:Ser/Thr protein kinase RdoA (MazF antagonist)